MNKDFVRQHQFFRGLPESFLDKIMESVGEVVFEEEKYLFREGQPSDCFFMVYTGAVTVEAVSQHGEKIKRILQPGDIIGWSWLVPPYRWHTSAYAEEDTRVFVFDGVQLQLDCEADHSFGFALFKRFSGLMGQRLATIHDPGVDAGRKPSGRSIKGLIEAIDMQEESLEMRKRMLAI